MADMDTIVSLCKRRGFVFPASEIYGGFGSTWDYGPLGAELKRNVREAWWRSVVYSRDDMVGLDSAILMASAVWEASGHVAGFTDPLVDCKACKQRFRADHLKGKACPECGGELTEARRFNLMFKTFVGPVEDEAAVAYLRPETAQGIFVNFANVLTTARRKLPFGIAQIGKAFRNEITPGNFIFRTREFEQMEIEYFVRPGEDERRHQEWIETRLEWYRNLGVRMENLRVRPHDPDELAHYAKACSDIEYQFPWGWAELEGIANRQDYDLKQHSKFSGQKLEYFDEESGEHITPIVIEPSAGVDRVSLMLLIDAYREEEVRGEKRVVMALHKSLAPYKVAILPLSKKEPLVALAKEVFASIRGRYAVTYDETQAIGRRYRRQDEIGTPYCVTVDFDSLEDKAVTVRDRDTMEQVRIPIAQLKAYLAERLLDCER